MNLPKVVILGRPNVGKSTLFNRLLGRRRALVHNLPGVTRDRIEEISEWIDPKGRRLELWLTDTGGMGGKIFDREIQAQVEQAMGEADIALMMVDGSQGVTEQDRSVLESLRRKNSFKGVKVIGVVNKADIVKHHEHEGEYYELGVKEWLSISAEHDTGVESLKHRLIEEIEKRGYEIGSTESFKPYEGALRIAVVGRPNVGKSTLINALLQKERLVTSPIAGTTVDAIDTVAELNGQPFVFVDTAGIRRKSKTEQGVEVLSVVQTKKALERADIAILVLDAEHGVADQDEKIAGMIEDAGCGVVLLLNKWDLQRKLYPGFTKEDAAERIRKQIRFLGYAPLLMASAKTKRGLDDIGDLLTEIRRQRQVKVGTTEFSEWVRKRARIHNPRNVKFYFSHQTSWNPPTFVCHVSDPSRVHFSLKRHMLNEIREEWGFMGNPVRLKFVKSGNK